MNDVSVRRSRPSDLEQLARLLHALWPDGSVEEHGQELMPILAGQPPGTMPLIIFVAEAGDGNLAGFLEVGLRSYADGCDPALPVGYVEGWYVSPEHRRKGIGADLLDAAQNWARTQGCVEIASDTWLDNHVSQWAHEALGFEVVGRSVNYRKAL